MGTNMAYLERARSSLPTLKSRRIHILLESLVPEPFAAVHGHPGCFVSHCMSEQPESMYGVHEKKRFYMSLVAVARTWRRLGLHSLWGSRRLSFRSRSQHWKRARKLYQPWCSERTTSPRTPPLRRCGRNGAHLDGAHSYLLTSCATEKQPSQLSSR